MPNRLNEARIESIGVSTMAKHEHGSMDIEVQEKTFAGFISAATWVCVVSALVLIFLAVFNS